ncbi:MAG: FAD-dependent oxidoreductase, partial [Ilumatobacteraceae bacterium]
DGTVDVHLDRPSGRDLVSGDVLMVATGRRPNGDQLNGEATGLEVGDDGHVVVDQYGRTTAPGIWALGDVNGRYQLKHMANGEATVVNHNVLSSGRGGGSPAITELEPFDARPAPHAVFSSPQIGAVGPTEQQAREVGAPLCVVTHDYAGAAYGWALEDTTSFVKLIGDPLTRKLVAAHVIGYQASLLVQLFVQGIHLGNTVDEMARGQIWIHPALSEVAEQALLKLIDEFDRFSR